MDYFEIIKRALKVTWKYKALWVLGFFVGGGGGGGGTSSYSNTYGTDPSSGAFSTAEFERAGEWLTLNWLPLVLIGTAVIAIMVFFTVAAQGGLVHMVNEAEENRQAKLGEGWREGFRRWGRTFMIDAVIALPILVLIGISVAMIIATVGGIAYGGEPSLAGAGGAFVGLCCGFSLLLIVLIAAIFLLGIVQSLALRYGVLQDMTFGAALSRGWKDLFGKRGAFVFELAMIIPGMVYGAVVGMFSLMFTVPSALMMESGNIGASAALSGLLGLALVVPSSAYAAFQSSAWTIFFRRMNGIELAPAIAAPAPEPSGFLPPPPVPLAPMPPAAPAAPAPATPEPPAPESPPYA